MVWILVVVILFEGAFAWDCFKKMREARQAFCLGVTVAYQNQEKITELTQRAARFERLFDDEMTRSNKLAFKLAQLTGRGCCDILEENEAGKEEKCMPDVQGLRRY